MNQQAAQQLKNGLYKLHWKEGGYSCAAVGRLHNGRVWFAPANWVSVAPMGIACTNWRLVLRVELVEESPC